jgi:hypothetical protein
MLVFSHLHGSKNELGEKKNQHYKGQVTKKKFIGGKIKLAYIVRVKTHLPLNKCLVHKGRGGVLKLIYLFILSLKYYYVFFLQVKNTNT